MSGTESFDIDNFDDEAWLEDFSDEIDYEDSYNLNDGYAGEEIGLQDEIPYKSAHSKRSRQMKQEYYNQWD